MATTWSEMSINEECLPIFFVIVNVYDITCTSLKVCGFFLAEANEIFIVSVAIKDLDLFTYFHLFVFY